MPLFAASDGPPAGAGLWPYLAVFLVAVAIDCIPFLAPPAWIALVVFLVRYDLDPWAVIVLGVAGITTGRYILSLYMPYVGRAVLARHKTEDLEALGRRLGRAPGPVFAFVLLYSLTPLSTSALFTAAGLSGARPGVLLPPFFLGKLVCYGALILTSHHLAADPDSLLHGAFTWKSAAWTVVGVLALLAFLAVDWRELLYRGRWRLDFRVWKRRRAA